MGADFSSFRRSNSERQPTAVNSDSINTSRSSIIEVMKPEFWKTKKMKKKFRPSDQPDKNIAKFRKLTLEELLMDSPGTPDCFSGGESYVFNHSYKRVHPSSTGVHTALSSRARDSFSLERRVHTDKGAEVESVVSLISTSQSGKLKKKVGFKLPEEADIIIFYSPESDRVCS